MAPILCANLDGYCATINNTNSVQPFPGCPSNVLNNDEWFAFFAGSTTITMVVTPSNCSPGNNMGLQGGIYQGCGGPIMDTQCACTTNPFTLTANNFIIGQIYWMVLDGCSGNVCDYSIDVTVGSTVGVPPANPGPITGPVNVCQGTTTGYSIAPVVGATSYVWTLNPPIVPTPGTGNSINIAWPAGNTSSAELCVTASNACYSNLTPSCTTIDIIPTPTATLSGSGFMCAGGPPMPVALSVAFTGEAPWKLIYTINGVAQPPITTSANPYVLSVSTAGTIGLQSVTTVAGNCPGTVSGSVNIQNIVIAPTTTAVSANCGLPNGSINLTPAGGTAPYTFLWSNGATTEDVTGIVGGMTYTATVTASNGCTGTSSVNVTNNNIPFTVSANVTANTTCIGGNGAITLTANPVGTYTYDWSNGATTAGQTGLTPGPYQVTVSAGGTCTQVVPLTIPDQPNAPVISTTTIPSTCELLNGSINASVSGGISPYTYLWSTGATTQNLTGVTGASYSLTVTGANGCTTASTVNLSNNNPPITITPTVVANTTCNGGNGSISLGIAPPGSYTYAWGGGETTASLTGLIPGPYQVTVNGGGSCTQTATINVPDNPNAPGVTATSFPTTCELSNGSVNISVSGGVTPYMFLWSSGATTQNLTMIAAGSYAVTVTGANGCTRTANVTVNNSNPPFTITPTIVANTICNGGNGSIAITVAPPNTYTYIWSTGGTATSITGLIPGSYQVTVSAGGVCTATGDYTIPNNPNTPVLTYTTVPSTCDLSNGSINLSVSGGVTPYSFLWSTGATSQNITALQAGGYDVTVTGANGCTSATSVTLGNVNPNFNVSPNIVANTNCNGTGNGAVSLTVTPPPGPYSYIWFNGATTNGLSGLLPGSYTVTVSAGGSCTKTLDITIPDNPNPPVLTFAVTSATCGLSNGAVNLSVSGGVTPYTYIWSSGQTSQDISGVAPNDYFVTVTGANGCSDVGLTTVGDNPVNVNIGGNVIDNTSCANNGNGSIAMNYSPLSATFIWSNNATTTNLTGLLPGDYTVTVSAGGSCTETETFTVFDDTEIPDLVLDVTPAVCGLPNGSIDLSVSGGISPYTYHWSNNAIAQDILNLPAGDFYVTVTSATGCTNIAVANVPDNDLGIILFGSIFENTSCLLPNGNIYLDVFPPGYNYVYKWSTGSMQINQSGLGTGFYTVTVTLGSCTGSETFEMTTDAVPPNLAVTGSAATCGVANGSAVANATGGVTPYTYKWSNNNMTANATNLLPGIYKVTVTGANGCSTTASVTIPNNTITLNVTGVIVPNTSCTSGNGALDISVMPAGTYNYIWSNGATTQDLNLLTEGTYTVTVSQGVSCSSSASFVVLKNTSDPVVLPAITAAICGQSNGAIDLTVTGGSTPYVYQWSNMAVSEDLSGILAGIYTVTVTAANGCTATEVMNVANNSSTFSLSGTATPYSNCTVNNGAVDLVITPPGAYQIVWSNMAVTEDLSGLTPGAYTVTVTQSGTCSASVAFFVLDETTYPTLSRSLVPEICGLSNASIDLSVTGGATPFVFSWSSTQITEDLTGIPAGTYTVTVTGANNCTAMIDAIVPNNAIAFTVDGLTIPNSSCSIINGGIDVTITPAGTYTYAWSNASATEDLTAIPGGSYTVTVSAGGTCTNAASYIVDDITNSPTIMETVTPALCGHADGAVSLNVSSSIAPYTFKWSTNATTQGLTGIVAGSYTVTVTGANGCSSVRTVTVPDNAYSPSVSGVNVPNTSCTTPNGSVALMVTPAAAYTFIWDSGQTTSGISGLSNGSYSVTVSAGGACTSIASFSVVNDTATPILASNLVNALCSKPTGSIDLTVSGAVTPYTYLWSTLAVTEDISALLSGTYTVIVTAANGCTTTDMFVLDNDSNNFNIAGAVTPNTSCVAPNGGINVTMLPAGSYTFKWSTNALTEDIAGVSPGTYTVTVTDATGCAISEILIIGENITAVTVSGTATGILCFGNAAGAIDVTVATGTPAYTYQWSPLQPGNPQDLTNIPAGNYGLTVTDTKGCTSVIAFAVTQPQAAIIIDCDQSKTVSLPGASDGEGSVTVNGGTPPYSIDWAPGASASGIQPGIFKIPNLSEGGYGVTVTDVNGCTIQCGFNIGLVDCTTEVGTMSSVELSACGAACITAVYNPIGQVLDPEDVLQFILHTGSSNAIVNELARNNQPQFCFNPATMSYGVTYYISAVAGNNDGAGNVLLTDFCTVVSFGSPILFYEKPAATAAQPAVLNCMHQQSTITGVSSIPGAVFQWTTTGQGQIFGNSNQASIEAVAAGTYRLIISANGCADTVSVVLTDLTNQPKAIISADPTDILDCSIDQIILSGEVEGSSNASTIWLSNGVAYATGSIVPVDQPGIYQFVVFDTLSFCSDTALITINENQAYPPLFVNPPGKITCNNPQVMISGGSPFTGIGFRWVVINATDTVIISNTSTATVSQPGTYYLVGYDPANTCTNMESVIVTADVALPVADAGGGFLIDCFGETVPLNGSAGGAVNLSIIWTTQNGNILSGAQTVAPLITLPGTYVIKVMNTDNGCFVTDEVVISPNAPVATLDVVQPPCFGQRGRIEVTSVSGGAPPVQYSLNGQPFTTQSKFPNLPGGEYLLLIKDAQGCSTTATATIVVPGIFDIAVIPETLVKLGESYLIEVTVNVSPSEINQIQWTPSEGLSCDSCLTTIATPFNITKYEVRAVNNNGCEDRATILIRVDKRLDIYAPNIISPEGPAPNNQFTIYTNPDIHMKIKTLQVYSRWGEMVFTKADFDPNNPELGWDGTFEGKPLNPAVFVWKAVLIGPDSKEILLSGDVTVER